MMEMELAELRRERDALKKRAGPQGDNASMGMPEIQVNFFAICLGRATIGRSKQRGLMIISGTVIVIKVKKLLGHITRKHLSRPIGLTSPPPRRCTGKGSHYRR